MKLLLLLLLLLFTQDFERYEEYVVSTKLADVVSLPRKSAFFFLHKLGLKQTQTFPWPSGWEDKGVHTFPKGICSKVNVIAQLEYELAYYDSKVHYTTRTPPELFDRVEMNELCSIELSLLSSNIFLLY